MAGAYDRTWSDGWGIFQNSKPPWLRLGAPLHGGDRRTDIDRGPPVSPAVIYSESTPHINEIDSRYELTYADDYGESCVICSPSGPVSRNTIL